MNCFLLIVVFLDRLDRPGRESIGYEEQREQDRKPYDAKRHQE